MTVTDVNALVNRFEQAAKMMKTVAKGGVPQVPGMGPMAGLAHGKGRSSAPAKKKGSKSGNPAKRAAENAGLAVPGAGSGGASGAGFGLGAGKPGGPTPEELDALQKFLGKG
jgi:signal recognition particle subunit SRP54